MKPPVKGGVTIDTNFHNYKSDRPSKPVDVNFGLYVGAGLVIPVGNFDVTANLTYHCYATTFPYSNIVATIGVRL